MWERKWILNLSLWSASKLLEDKLAFCKQTLINSVENGCEMVSDCHPWMRHITLPPHRVPTGWETILPRATEQNLWRGKISKGRDVPVKAEAKCHFFGNSHTEDVMQSRHKMDSWQIHRFSRSSQLICWEGTVWISRKCVWRKLIYNQCNIWLWNQQGWVFCKAKERQCVTNKILCYVPLSSLSSTFSALQMTQPGSFIHYLHLQTFTKYQTHVPGPALVIYIL